MRSGTENVPGIAGLGVAAKEMYRDHEEKIAYIADLKNYLIEKLEALEGVTVNSLRGMESAPHIVSASFEGIRGEVLLHALEDVDYCAEALKGLLPALRRYRRG